MKLSTLPKLKLLLLSALLLSLTSTGQTTLSVGDIAFTGYNGDGNDSFSFILLTNISSGTVIKFTDGGWNGTGFRNLEYEIAWTAGSAMSALDVVTISHLTATTGTVTGTAVSMASSGDQIFAYQGTFASPTTIIAGIHMNVENSSYPAVGPLTTTTGDWDGVSSPGATQSSLIGTGLTNGVNCVWLYDSTNTSNWEVDNARALCTALTGTISQIRAKLNNRAYWEFDNTTPFAPCHPSCTAAITSTTWNGSTWSNGSPSSTVDAVIASSTAPNSFACKNLTINSGVPLNTSTGNTVTIHGDLTNNGNGVSGTGLLIFAKSGTSTLSGNAFSTFCRIQVSSGCTLATANKLTLASNSSNEGRIGSLSGSITGNVTVNRFVSGGNRAYRFLAHPFTTTQSVSMLTDDIDITGNGGATNGFTTTTTNNPSAYIWNVATADNSTTGNNPGWSAITSTSTSSWTKGGLLRVLVRGRKGQGLTGGSYTPSSATIDMTGTVNTGTQVITLTKGSNSNFVACGNPFPSPVQMDALSKGSNVGANYYVWDATSGTKGAYVTNAFTTSYVLPTCGAFFTTVSANSNNTITFEEGDKSSNSPASIFKTTGANDWVELLIADSTLKWDRLLIHFDDNSMDVEDKLDAVKLYNPGLDFFTLSKDGERLAIDVRPYNDGTSIPLGLTAYNRYNKYVIRTGDYNVPAGTKLILHDKYLNTKQELKTGFEYWFDVTSDTLSQGNNRFEINMVGKPTNIISTGITTPMIQLIPNPARSEVKVSFAELEGKAQVKLMSVTGQVVYAQEVNASTGSLTIPLSNMPTGMYIVELQSENARFTEKLIKE